MEYLGYIHTNGLNRNYNWKLTSRVAIMFAVRYVQAGGNICEAEHSSEHVAYWHTYVIICTRNSPNYSDLPKAAVSLLPLKLSGASINHLMGLYL